MKTTVAELIQVAKTCKGIDLYTNVHDYPNSEWNDGDYDVDENYEQMWFSQMTPEQFFATRLPNVEEVECCYELIDSERWSEMECSCTASWESLGLYEDDKIMYLAIFADDDNE